MDWFEDYLKEKFPNENIVFDKEKISNDLLSKFETRKKLAVLKNPDLNFYDDEHYLWVYGDTDSVCINVNWLPEIFKTEKIDKLFEFLKMCEKKINEMLIEYSKKKNTKIQTIQIELENVSDKSIFLAKKLYFMSLKIKDGIILQKPELKVKGISIVKSSTPKKIRKQLKDSLNYLLNADETEIKKYLKTIKKEFMESDFEDIAFPRSLNNLNKYYDTKKVYKKGSPIQVKGSLVWNAYIDFKNYPEQFKLMNGSKIKFIYLKEPNVFNCNVISFNLVPPDLKKYISEKVDWNLMYEKVVMSSINQLIEPLNISLKSSKNLNRFLRRK